MGANMEFEGMGEILDHLEMMVSDVKSVTDKALTAGAKPILNEAKRTTAFIDRSGDLRKSLKVGKVKTDKKGRKYILIGSFKRDGFKARMVEFGTSTADAHPFLAPAFENRYTEAYKNMREVLTEALK